MSAFDEYDSASKPGDILIHRPTGSRFLRLRPDGDSVFEWSIAEIGTGTIHSVSELMRHDDRFRDVFSVIPGSSCHVLSDREYDLVADCFVGPIPA